MRPIPKDRLTPQCRTAYAPQVSGLFKKNRKQRFSTEYPSAHTGYALKVTMHSLCLEEGLPILKGHCPEAVRFEHCSTGRNAPGSRDAATGLHARKPR